MKRALIVVLFLASGCGIQDSSTFTLFRSSPTDSLMRVHVATFDSKSDSNTYNQENCEIARSLFSGQRGVTVRYWCEKGRAK